MSSAKNNINNNKVKPLDGYKSERGITEAAAEGAGKGDREEELPAPSPALSRGRALAKVSKHLWKLKQK